MQLLDVPRRCWSDEMLSKLGIDRSQVANVYESQEVSGKVSGSVAAVTGLREGTPVVGGGGDQAAGAVGNGIVKPGVISSTIGTSGVICIPDKISIDPREDADLCHAVPNKWHVMGVTQAAGFSLNGSGILCKDEINVAGLMDVDPYVLMTRG